VQGRNTLPEAINMDETDPTDQTGRGTWGAVARRAVWWIGAAVCAFYGAYAFSMGASGAPALLGLADGVPHRAAPPAGA
jgi:hypothetical protein